MLTYYALALHRLELMGCGLLRFLTWDLILCADRYMAYPNLCLQRGADLRGKS